MEELSRAAMIVFLAALLPAVASASHDPGFFHAVYGVWNYSLLGELGFDAVYEEVWWTDGADKALAKFRNESVLAAAYNISYICGPYYEVTVPSFNYTRAVNANGHVEARTPSRIEETYWHELIEEPGLAIANLSLHYPIWGIVWDMEDYLKEDFTYWDYTFDDLALQGFASDAGISVPSLLPSERQKWLQSQGLLEEFQHWEEQKVYDLARATAHRIYAINPNLTLGILAFEDDSWFHLSILRGFSSAKRPVMAWHEDTYSGYKKGKIDHNRKVFAQLGINGRVVPGLWSLLIPPFQLLNHMEFATRDNGAFWIYQRATDPWILGPEEDYVTVFRLFQDHIWFKGSPNPKDPFEVFPGVEIRPNLGPEGVSAILDRGETLRSAVCGIELSPTIANLTYVGENLSVKTLNRSHLTPDDLPCLVWGLTAEDLRAIRAWGSLRELEELLSVHSALELPELLAFHAALSDSLESFRDGRYDRVISELEPVLEEAYSTVLDQVWPLVEAGFSNPRNSGVPMLVLNRIYTARRQFDEGDQSQGRISLLEGLKEWKEISEAYASGPALAIAMILLAMGRSGKLMEYSKPVKVATLADNATPWRAVYR